MRPSTCSSPPGTASSRRRSSWSTTRRSKSDGIIAINLADDDELISVRHASEGADVVIVSRNGKGIRFPQTDARPMGRATGGVKGITLGKGDVVLSMDVVSDDAARPVHDHRARLRQAHRRSRSTGPRAAAARAS